MVHGQEHGCWAISFLGQWCWSSGEVHELVKGTLHCRAMSRCFPFPPPGYEKKARNDDVELLAKEKRREKKHKKEKEEKENRKGKQKKDKERSKDKHTEKKEKEEKHKSKKKEKERENEKNNSSDDRKAEGRSVVCNEENPGQSRCQANVCTDTKIADQLGRHLRDEATMAGNKVFREFCDPVQRRMESMCGAPDQRKVESVGRAVEKDCEKRTQWKGRKEGDERWAERDKAEVGRITRNEMAQKINGMDQRAGKMDGQRKVEGKEKIKERNAEGGDKRGDRHRERDRDEKESKRKSKEKEKEKEKVKEKEVRHKEQEQLRESQMAQMYKLNNKPQFPNADRKETEKSIGSEGNIKKRKDFVTNCFIHEYDLWPNKLPRLASSSQMFLANGRKLEPSVIAIQSTSDRNGETDTRKGEINKEQKVNGVIEAQPSAITSWPRALVKPCMNGEASTRPPHADSIHLDQLLLLPKMVEVSNFDDQEWLFSRDNLHLNPKAASVDTKTPQVWAEARWIESGDVCALPYVIPY